MTKEEIEEYLLENECEGAPMMDGFKEAFIGHADIRDGLACYSYKKMVEVLCDRDGMEPEEAVEYIDYNCVVSINHRGRQKYPIIINDYYV